MNARKPEEYVKRDPVQRRLYVKIIKHIPFLKHMTKIAVIKALLVSLRMEGDQYDQ